MFEQLSGKWQFALKVNLWYGWDQSVIEPRSAHDDELEIHNLLLVMMGSILRLVVQMLSSVAQLNAQSGWW